jgi:hypothetical protein
MGTYIYSLKGPSRNVQVNINGNIESVALLSFSHKPTGNTWNGEPRWQILANARIQHMDNIWSARGYPKYVCHVYIEADGSIEWKNSRVSEWNLKMASISDGNTTYDNLKTVGWLKQKNGKVWELTQEWKSIEQYER